MVSVLTKIATKFISEVFSVNCSEDQLLFPCRSSAAEDFERVGACVSFPSSPALDISGAFYLSS